MPTETDDRMGVAAMTAAHEPERERERSTTSRDAAVGDSVVNADSVLIVVHGEPAPQGSKTKWGTEANPRTRPWRNTVTQRVGDALGSDHEVWTEPVSLVLMFSYPRPASHFTTRGALSANGRRRPYPTQPDLDKLSRAVLDALTGVLYRDDRQVVRLFALREWDSTASVTIQAQRLPGEVEQRVAS